VAPKYDIDFYIEFFTNIPDEKWSSGPGYFGPNGTQCALQFCRYTDIKDKGRFEALLDIFNKKGFCPVKINDGEDKTFEGDHPKTRILNALKSFKNTK
jgi:hypothetical protein